jgi:hypothetical protein
VNSAHAQQFSVGTPWEQKASIRVNWSQGRPNSRQQAEAWSRERAADHAAGHAVADARAWSPGHLARCTPRIVGSPPGDVGVV